MAEQRSAWGIEIGQAGLKAIRLRTDADGQSVRATAFDYIPHPKILSQPDAVPGELIEQSVRTFLERNDIGNDQIGISVPGHTSLAKFIKLPPVEPGKVSEIVQYEARQQIPFDLDEVVWDFQPIGGGVEESGFMLEAEVGLFAMKRELVYEAMRPLTDQGEEVEVVQISPLALYNYLSWDVLSFRKTEETPEPPESEDYYILLDMGADNTTLLVSNGRSIWIRNVPIGGNHFTRALTREMKLTFAKAEHLKCNATKSPDPKAVFQAMRPVFNDYVTEIQRSIGYFGSVNRAAKIRKVIGVGNGFKLAGLQKFLQQNLQYEVERLEHLDGVTGDSVLSDPVFLDNAMTFAVPYGLALQTLKQTRIHTTLLPPEIVTERKIRRKKPWVVAAAAMLLAALGLSTAVTAKVLHSVSSDRFQDSYAAVKRHKESVNKLKTDYSAQEARHSNLEDQINRIAAPLKNRTLWMEIYKAINECLPRDEGEDLDEANVALQKKIRITSIVSQRVADVAAWHADIMKVKDGEKFEDKTLREPPESAEGYIFTINGYHFFNDAEEAGYENIGIGFLNQTIIHNLRQPSLTRDGQKIPVGELGITHAVVVSDEDVQHSYNPNARSGVRQSTAGGIPTPGAGNSGGRGLTGRGLGGRGGRNLFGSGRDRDDDEDRGGGRGQPRGRASLQGGNQVIDEFSEEESDETVDLERTDFVIQFAWVPKVDEADKSKKKKKKKRGGGGFAW